MARSNISLFFFIFLTCCASIAGALWYAFHAEIIIFNLPTVAEYSAAVSDKKTVCLFWYTEKEKVAEQTEIIWSHSTSSNIATLITTWLSYMQEDDLLDKRIKIEMIATTPDDHEAFISCSHSVFNQQSSIIQKWYILEGLFSTVHAVFPQLRTLRFLLRDQPLYDDHLDCSQSLPCTVFLQHYTLPTVSALRKKEKYTLVINPCGDKNMTGRVIAREFERKLTRTLAEDIKTILEKTGLFTVLIAHEIGQSPQQEELATLANRVGADLYIQLNCFESKKMLPEINCYFPLYNPTTDFWYKKVDPLSLIPINKAYLKKLHDSFTWCTGLTDFLKQVHDQHYIITQPYGLPLRQLIGIDTPSCVIELGIQKIEQIEELAKLVSTALHHEISR